MQFQAKVLMFTRRHWKILSFGLASFLLAIAFSFLGTWPLFNHLPFLGNLPKTMPGRAQAIALSEPSPVLAQSPVVEFPGVDSPGVDSPGVEFERFPTEPAVKANPTKAAVPSVNTKFGHFPYVEAQPEDLRLAGHYGSRPEQLHQDAAQAYKAMAAAARREGIHLITISGFRDQQVQAELFAAQTLRQGSEARAARISAPPGHSEHHTGYAIDMGDDDNPNTDLEVAFEQTPAFRWLEAYAGQFGFELSFPRGNRQGVMYEPWHWRFVGTPQAGKTFALANRMDR